MKLRNSFEVPTDIDSAWARLSDFPTVADALPGASLDSFTADEVKGSVKVKLGPVAMTFRGVAEVQLDPESKAMVMQGRAKDVRGGGGATVAIRAQLTDLGASTRVDVDTDLDVTGKAAQFGRGVMSDVSSRILAQFATNLAASLQEQPINGVSGSTVPESLQGTTDSSSRARGGITEPHRASEPLDLGPMTLMPLARRVVPVLALVIVLTVVKRRCRRR
ncbi:SRPBCC family protein [Nocardioides sp.]|uniref:SRPBCC family protein n=1 Tax=Nocardioides sp. TaxID=35761 RepID=UPI00378504BD